MSGYPSTVTQFWAVEVSEKRSESYEPDADGDLSLQLTSVCFASADAKKGESYVVSLSADDSPPYTIAILRAGVTDQVAIDVMIGAGNEKVTFHVKGGSAKIHVSGYEILEDNGDDDFDEDHFDDDDDDDDDDDLFPEVTPGSELMSFPGFCAMHARFCGGDSEDLQLVMSLMSPDAFIEKHDWLKDLLDNTVLVDANRGPCACRTTACAPASCCTAAA